MTPDYLGPSADQLRKKLLFAGMTSGRFVEVASSGVAIALLILKLKLFGVILNKLNITSWFLSPSDAMLE